MYMFHFTSFHFIAWSVLYSLRCIYVLDLKQSALRIGGKRVIKWVLHLPIDYYLRLQRVTENGEQQIPQEHEVDSQVIVFS